MSEPAETEPDGDRWLPHHGLVGLLGLVASGVLGLVGWAMWHAAGDPSLGSDLVTLAAGAGLASALLLLDDLASHKFGVWTPADAAFRALMRSARFRRWWRRLTAYRR